MTDHLSVQRPNNSRILQYFEDILPERNFVGGGKRPMFLEACLEWQNCTLVEGFVLLKNDKSQGNLRRRYPKKKIT